jgi:hypothetical protein
VAEIIVHAGMAKTGSTSVQRWLTQNRELLAAQHVQLVVACDRRSSDHNE